MIKKELIFVLMILTVFLISACDVYNTLYVKQPGIQGEAVTVPEGNITIEVIEEKEETDEEIEEVGIEVDEGVEESEEIDEIIVDVEEVEMVEVEEEIEVTIDEEDIETGDAVVIIVEETELVNLVPRAEDPDQDTLIFTFTSPLDGDGKWQTTYGDAGEYTITVTASDGTLTASREVLVIVNKKEEAPVFGSFSPQETAIDIDETETAKFQVTASDLNNDDLTFSWKLDGIVVSDEQNYAYESTFEDSGSHTVKITVSDGMFDTERIWAVTVNNVNRKPALEGIDDVQAEETDTVVIELQASDPDGDELSYEIDDDRFVQDGNVFTWETTFDDSGEYAITITITDGTDTTTQEVIVTIDNVNRPPQILDIIQG